MFKFLVTTAKLMLCTVAQAANYTIDIPGQHAFINFKASHLGYSYIVGGFNTFSGSYSYDPENPAASGVTVEIDAGSLDTNHAERDKHLKSDEFFDVAKHTTITFESTGFKGSAEGGTLTGNLSIRGITKTVDLEVTRIGEGNDPWGGYRSGFQDVVTFNAGDYGMPAWIGDVDVELIIEGIHQ